MSNTSFEIRRDLILAAKDIAVYNAENATSLQNQTLEAYRDDLKVFQDKIGAMKPIQISTDDVLVEAEKLNVFVSKR
jgi:phage gp36-like protein